MSGGLNWEKIGRVIALVFLYNLLHIGLPFDVYLLRCLLSSVYEHTPIQIAMGKLCHVDERHAAGVETEHENIPCKLHARVSAQIQRFQLFDDFQREGSLDGLVNASIYVFEWRRLWYQSVIHGMVIDSAKGAQIIRGGIAA